MNRGPGRLLPLLAAAGLAVAGCEPPPPAPAGSDLSVLAQTAAGYAQARPGTVLAFPRDHGPHPDFRIEWWYLTANLEDARGRPWGAQWTLFRFATRPPGEEPPRNPWQDGQVFMAHLAVTSEDEHAAMQRYARGGDHGGVARAGVRAQPFAAWLDDWSLASADPDAWLPLRLQAGQGEVAVDLRLDSAQDLVLQGDAGYSQKHPAGGGSHYYSQPFLQATGEVRFAGETVAVTGHAWLDREWSSQFLQADQAGWDWFALHLDSGEKLMLFQLRGRDGADDYRHAILIGADGSRRTLDSAGIGLEALATEPVAGRQLPLRWRIDLPQAGRRLQVEALHPDQWMDVDFPYWEGYVTVRGQDAGSRGRGYMELTGYR